MWHEAMQGTQLVDAVIALTVFEAIALSLYHRSTARGVAPRDFAINVLSGLMLMLALRSRITNADGLWTAAFLAAAGVVHATDMWSRWKR